MRTHYAKGAVAVLTCALVALPAGAAYAGSGPAPKPAERPGVRSAAPSPQGNPASVRARAAKVCADAHQIGSTGYVKRNGTTIASVKQFYSAKCKKNYGYVWVWDSFRNEKGDYDVTAGVYSYTQDKALGSKTWTKTRQQEFWSTGADTPKDCTAALGVVRKTGEPQSNQGLSSKRC